MRWANDRLRLILTSQCNLACGYCHNEGQAKGVNYLSPLLFERILDLVEAVPPTGGISLSGGEPLLHPHLDSYLRRLESLSPERTLVTNGLLLSPHRLASLRAAGITKLRIGVDSLSRLRSRPSPVPTGTPHIRDVLSMLESEGVPYELNVVLTRFNKDEIVTLLRYAGRHRVSVKFFEHVSARWVYHKGATAAVSSRPLVSNEHFTRELLSVFPTARPVPADRFGDANDVYDCEGLTIRYCRYLCDYGLCWLTGTRIDPKGFVYTCMVGNGRDRILHTDDLQESLRTLGAAEDRGCVADTALLSARL